MKRRRTAIVPLACVVRVLLKFVFGDVGILCGLFSGFFVFLEIGDRDRGKVEVVCAVRSLEGVED